MTKSNKLNHVETRFFHDDNGIETGGFMVVFENEAGARFIIQILDDIFMCPGFNCDMHDYWCTANLKEPNQNSFGNHYTETMYLVKKETFHFNPELVIDIGFDYALWQVKYAYEGEVGIKAFRNLECRQRYLKEVAFAPEDRTIWHDDHIDNYSGKAYF